MAKFLIHNILKGERLFGFINTSGVYEHKDQTLTKLFTIESSIILIILSKFLMQS